MKTTLPDDDDPIVSEWCLFIAAHSDDARVGTRRALVRGTQLLIGREEDGFGAGALADGKISRTHARFEVDPSGALRIADLGSSNGTHVNGARVSMVTLAPGDVVRVGGVLMVVQRAPTTLRAARSALAGVGPALSRMQQALDRLSLDEDVALVEAHGAGAARVAAELAARSGGPAREFALGSWVDRLPVPFEDALSAKDGRALVLGSLPAKGTLARSLLRERLSAPRSERSARRILVIDESSSADVELAEQLGAEAVRVPPLRDRPEDIPFAVRQRCASLGRPLPALSLRGWLSLLRAPWPANLAQLEATVDRGLDALARNEPEDVDQWMLEAARSELALTPVAHHAGAERPTSADEPAYVFADSGRWFALPDGARVSLHRREVLARVLGALVQARRAHPGRVVRAEQLIELAWPGEKLIEGSGENRLHVALSNLRQLGLRAVLLRLEDGYRLDPEAPARFLDE